MFNEKSISGYVNYLPAVFQQDPFIGRFLLAFEAILSGSEDAKQPGLEETIGRMAEAFDPQTTREEFLPWLAGWVALSLRADWDAPTKRRFIEQIVPLYRLRGTQAGLEQLLRLYTQENVTIYDAFTQPAHFFQVQLRLSEADPDRLRVKQQIARAIIDQEKPAHTFYALKVSVPTMRLVSLAKQVELEKTEGVKPPLLILGKNTTLGSS